MALTFQRPQACSWVAWVAMAGPLSVTSTVLQVRLVCEYCDKGSLREALDLGAYKRPYSLRTAQNAVSQLSCIVNLCTAGTVGLRIL